MFGCFLLIYWERYYVPLTSAVNNVLFETCSSTYMRVCSVFFFLFSFFKQILLVFLKNLVDIIYFFNKNYEIIFFFYANKINFFYYFFTFLFHTKFLKNWFFDPFFIFFSLKNSIFSSKIDIKNYFFSSFYMFFFYFFCFFYLKIKLYNPN